MRYREYDNIPDAIDYERALWRQRYNALIVAAGLNPGDRLETNDGAMVTVPVGDRCGYVIEADGSYVVEVPDTEYTALGSPAELVALTSLSAAAQAAINGGTAYRGIDYFLKSNGSDSADGRTMGTAWKTYAKAAATMVSLDRLWLRGGDTWFEEFVDTAQGTYVGVRGNARATIDARDPVPAESWTPTPGRTNVYQTSWSHGFAADGGKSDHRLWEGDTRMRRQLSLDGCESIAGTCYAATPTTGGPDTIYLHPTGNLDPRTSGVQYRATKRRWCFQLYQSQNQAVVSDLVTIGNSYTDGSLVYDGHGYRCTAEDGRYHCFFFRGYGEDIVGDRIEPPDVIGGATMAVTYSDPGSSAWNAGRNTIYVRCRVLAEAAALSPGGFTNVAFTVGFYSHASDQTHGTIYYEDCYSENCWNPYGAGQCTRAVLFRSGCSNAIFGIQLYADNELVVLGGEWQMRDSAGDRMLAYVTDFGLPDTVIMRGCKVYKRGSSFGTLTAALAGATIDISRCTFAAGIKGLSNNVPSAVSLTFNNNVVACDGNANFMLSLGSGGVAVPYVGDGNCYFSGNQSGTSLPWRDEFAASIGGLAAWQTYTADEAASIEQDPDLEDPANGDFTINDATVLALGAGAEPDETDDATLMSLLATYGL